MSTVNGDEAYVPRMSTGIPGLDLQLGGGTRLTASGCESDFGLVRPSFVVLAGPPGVGKSRVLWQIVRKVTADCASVLCVSDAMRADDEVRANVRVRRAWAATLRQLGHDVRRHRPAVLILDGLQDVLKNEPLPSLRAGQTKEDRHLELVCRAAMSFARSGLCVLASAMTRKDGRISPVIRHRGDAVIEMTRGEEGLQFLATKSRSGRLARAA